MASKKTKNGQFWPFWPCWPFFGIDQSGTHPLKSRLRFAEVMSGLCPAEKVRSLQISQKWPIFTILPHLTLSWSFFLTGTRWNSPKKFMIKVCWGTARSHPSEKRHFRAPMAFKKTKNYQFWPFQLIWHKVDHFLEGKIGSDFFKRL